jgi:transposase InsO family protein
MVPGGLRNRLKLMAFRAVVRIKAATLMKLTDVAAKQKKKFKVTTDSKHTLPVAPNLLNREFTVKEPDQVYVSDMTYMWTNEGWFYLAVRDYRFVFAAGCGMVHE